MGFLRCVRSLLTSDSAMVLSYGLAWVLAIFLGALVSSYNDVVGLGSLKIGKWWTVVGMAVVGFVLCAILANWQVRQAHETKFGQLNREAREKDGRLHELNIFFMLKQLAEMIAKPGFKSRACVFLPEADGKLHIAYSHNMEGDPDQGLVLERNQGCSGDAWANCEIVFTDLREVPPEDLRSKWKMRPDQIKLTEGLGSILSIPLFQPYNERRVIGVLSVDSTGTLDESGLKSDDLREQCQQSATVLAGMLCLAGLASE